MLTCVPEKTFIFAAAGNLPWEIIFISAGRLGNETVNGGFSLWSPAGGMWPRGARGWEWDDILAAFVTWTSFAWDVFGLCAMKLWGSQRNQDPSSNKFKFWFCELCTNIFFP